MAARDTYHDQMRHALERDGWTITHDPLRVKVRRRKLYIDVLRGVTFDPVKEEIVRWIP